jgi:hypothetical protein
VSRAAVRQLLVQHLEEGDVQERPRGESLQQGAGHVRRQSAAAGLGHSRTDPDADRRRDGKQQDVDDCQSTGRQRLGEPQSGRESHDDLVQGDGGEQSPQLSISEEKSAQRN